MNEKITQDFAAYEEEAGILLSVYENLPDAVFEKSELLPHNFIVSKIKAFARAYSTLEVLQPNSSGLVIN
jgi:hypothetical protein